MQTMPKQPPAPAPPATAYASGRAVMLSTPPPTVREALPQPSLWFPRVPTHVIPVPPARTGIPA